MQLEDLYQELILDHNRAPHNFGTIDVATHHAEGRNPLCGDHLSLFLRVEAGIVREARFEGAGCAISKASSSLMTDAITGKSVTEVRALFSTFHDLVAGEDVANPAVELGKLRAFAGVHEFPVRVKCATLAWQTLMAALDREATAVTTEV